MHNPRQTNHKYHGSRRYLGCAPCLTASKRDWLTGEIAKDPSNYNQRTGLFTRPVGMQYGHNLAVIRGNK